MRHRKTLQHPGVIRDAGSIDLKSDRWVISDRVSARPRVKLKNAETELAERLADARDTRIVKGRGVRTLRHRCGRPVGGITPTAVGGSGFPGRTAGLHVRQDKRSRVKEAKAGVETKI